MGFKFRKRFDPKEHAFDPDGHRYISNVPKGEYLLKIVKSDRQEGRGDNPPVGIHVYEIVEGPTDEVKGRWLRQWFHFWHVDAPARQRYAAGKMSQICTALDTGPIQDTKVLEGKTLACPIEMRGYGDEGKSSIEFGNFYPATAFNSKDGGQIIDKPPANDTPPASDTTETESSGAAGWDDDDKVPF